jgi:hypothetical protein
MNERIRELAEQLDPVPTKELDLYKKAFGVEE